ncbi:MAG: c-type cytochrome [Phycisphaeraceae bacterium]
MLKQVKQAGVLGLVLLLALACLAVDWSVLRSGSSGGSEFRSPVALAVGPRDRLYVAEATASRIAVVDAADRELLREFDVDLSPRALCLTDHGTTLLVVGGGADGSLLLLDPAGGRVQRRVRTGHTPTAVAASADGKRAWVADRFDDRVSVVDLEAGRVTGHLPAVREPVALALAAGGKRLLVGNHQPAGRADGDYIGCAVSVYDAESGEPVSEVALANGSTAVREMASSPDGKYVYVTHVLGRYQVPTTQLERGWMNTNALSIIDAERGELVNTVLLDTIHRGAANPWGVAVSEDGRWLVVAHAGTHEVSVIDRGKLHERLAAAAAGERVTEATKRAADVPNDLSFLAGIRRRLPTAGDGPRGVAIAGDAIYAAEYFGDSVGVLSAAAGDGERGVSVSLGEVPEMTQERRGELLFNDARLCYQNWQSCASCHPDARSDSLNWDLLNDGIGNPRSSKSMLLAHETPPAMITGIRPDAETAVRAGMKYIQFIDQPEEDAEAMDAFLRSLEPVPSPHLESGELSAAAKDGKQVFEQAGCASCHSGAYYTDMQKYDVGTGGPMDTPALVEAWRTAPYLNDGRAATLREVVTSFNEGDTHGKTSDLSEREIDVLVEYMLSL